MSTPDKKSIQKIIFLISPPKHVVGTHEKCFVEKKEIYPYQ